MYLVTRRLEHSLAASTMVIQELQKKETGMSLWSILRSVGRMYLMLLQNVVFYTRSLDEHNLFAR